MQRFLSAGRLCLLATTLLGAQPAQLRGPLSGFVYDPPSKSIRPIAGIPGAAWLGRAAATELDSAWIAPSGRAAIAVRDGRLLLIRLAGETPEEIAVDAALAGVERASWSPDSSAAAIYSTQAAAVQTVSIAGMAGAPIAVEGAVSALALSSGGTLVAGVAAEGGSGLYLLSPDAPPVAVLPLAHATAAVFDAGGTLYAADSSGEIYALRDLGGGAPGVSRAVAPEDSITDPAGIAVLPRGRLLIAGGRLARICDLATGMGLADVPLEAPVESLGALALDGLVLLSPRSGPHQPALVLDSSIPGVRFVPGGGEEERQ